jgi:hypothetical protein
MLKIIKIGKNPVEIKKGDIVKIHAPGLPGNGKTGRVLSSHGDHFQIESGPNEHKNYMHPASRLTIVKKNPKRKSRKGKIKRRVKRKRAVIHKRKAKRTKKRKVIRARKNPPRALKRHETIIVGFASWGHPRKAKRVYFTGKSFSRNKDDAKLFPGDAAKYEAHRILPMLPYAIKRIMVEKA